MFYFVVLIHRRYWRRWQFR